MACILFSCSARLERKQPPEHRYIAQSPGRGTQAFNVSPSPLISPMQVSIPCSANPLVRCFAYIIHCRLTSFPWTTVSFVLEGKPAPPSSPRIPQRGTSTLCAPARSRPPSFLPPSSLLPPPSSGRHPARRRRCRGTTACWP